MPATRAILSEADFRDWAQIKGWARGIALLNAARPPHRTAEAVPSLPPHFKSRPRYRRPRPDRIAVLRRVRPALIMTRQHRVETSCPRGEGPGSRQNHATWPPAANEDVSLGQGIAVVVRRDDEHEVLVFTWTGRVRGAPAEPEVHLKSSGSLCSSSSPGGRRRIGGTPWNIAADRLPSNRGVVHVAH
jgi:hypothetical protein